MEKKSALTPWFPAEVAPVHAGVYEIDAACEFGGRCFSHFDGYIWSCSAWEQRQGPEDAIARANSYAGAAGLLGGNVSWRGLAESPNA